MWFCHLFRNIAYLLKDVNCRFFVTVLWGLDAEGKFLTGENTDKEDNLFLNLKARCFKKPVANVREAVLMDLKRIHETVDAELQAIKDRNAAKFEVGKKLLFLFQCDLLPGISGKILDLKGSRDSSNVKHVSVRDKMLGWAFLLLLDLGMMFYILLFALTQTGPKQNAWFLSFALWLFVEILFVSTAIVFITHILIPSMIMKDLTQIKRRLMDNIRDFNDRVKENAKNQVKTNESVEFNAANYLFVSTRLARQFPDLKESKIISHFSTPWPRQSYLRVQNVSKKYSKKFSAFTRSASILLIFFVGNFLSVPPSVQDIIVQMTSTSAIGYIVLVHVQLFEIFPALVILPALVLVVLAHFIVQSGKADAQLKLARLFPTTRKKEKNPEKAAKDALAAEFVTDVEDYECKISEESDSIGSEAAGAMVVVRSANINTHRTRRQSISAGIDVIHALQDRIRRGEELVYQPSEISDLSVSSESTGENRSDIDQLHRPPGAQSSFHRVLSRGVGLVAAKSRASDYSVDVPVLGDEYEEVSDSSDSESSFEENSDESSNNGNCSSSSDSGSDSENEDEEDSNREEIGELVDVKKARAYSASLSTISNQVPWHLREDFSEVSSSDYADSIFLVPARETITQHPQTVEPVSHTFTSTNVRDGSSCTGSSSHTSSDSSGDTASVSGLSADRDTIRARREDLAPIHIVYGDLSSVKLSPQFTRTFTLPSHELSRPSIGQKEIEGRSGTSSSCDNDSEKSEETSDGVDFHVHYCPLNEHTGSTPLSHTPPRSADRSIALSSNTTIRASAVDNDIGNENRSEEKNSDNSSSHAGIANSIFMSSHQAAPLAVDNGSEDENETDESSSDEAYSQNMAECDATRTPEGTM